METQNFHDPYNGKFKYIKFYYPLLNDLMKTTLPNHEIRIILTIARLTWGFHKKEAVITLEQFSNYTEISDHSNISKTIKSLSEKIDNKKYKYSIYINQAQNGGIPTPVKKTADISNESKELILFNEKAAQKYYKTTPFVSQTQKQNLNSRVDELLEAGYSLNDIKKRIKYYYRNSTESKEGIFKYGTNLSTILGDFIFNRNFKDETIDPMDTYYRSFDNMPK